MQLSDQELHAKMVTLRKYEREVLVELLEHLQEVFDRRLFCDYGHSSIVKYLVKELGYSESAAFRRVQALRLSKEFPEAKTMIEKGELNLTSASLIQSGLKDKSDRKEVLKNAADKTTEQTQKMILAINPDLRKKDIINPVSEGESRVHLTFSEDTLEKLNLLKSKLNNNNTDEVVNLALTKILEKLDITNTKTNKLKYVACKNVPRSTVKKVLTRAKKQCEFPGCNEKYNLEIDHIVPRAKGGSNLLSNLRLYCKAHNQRAAIKEFGQKHMSKFLQ